MADTSDQFGIATVRNDDGTAAASPAGDIDVYTSSRLRQCLEALIAEGHTKITLDLRAVEFIDSSGLGTLVTVHKRAVTHGVQLTVVGPRPHVLRVMEISGIRRIIDLESHGG